MTINIGAYVTDGLAIAKKLGVAGSVTITRASGSPLSFTCDAVAEGGESVPANDGLSPDRPRTFTVAGPACVFVPETGHLLTAGSAVYRVHSAVAVIPDGVTVAAYTIAVVT